MFLPNIHTMSGSRPPTTEKQTKKETKVQPQYGLTTNLALQGEERKEGGFTRDQEAFYFYNNDHNFFFYCEPLS